MKITSLYIPFICIVLLISACGNLNKEIWFKKTGEATMKLEFLAGDYVSLYEKCPHKDVKSTFIDNKVKNLTNLDNKATPTNTPNDNGLIVFEEKVAPTSYPKKPKASDAIHMKEEQSVEIVMEEEPNDQIMIEEAPSDYDETPMIKHRDLMAGLDKNMDTIINFGKKLKEANITPYDNSEPLNQWNVHYVNNVNQSPDKDMDFGLMQYNNSNIVQVSFDYKNKDVLKMYYDEVDNISKQLKSFSISPFENIYYDHNIAAKNVKGASMVYKRDKALIDKINGMNDQELDAYIKNYAATTNNVILHLPGKLKKVDGVKYKSIDEMTIMITPDMIALFRNGNLPAFTVSYY